MPTGSGLLNSALKTLLNLSAFSKKQMLHRFGKPAARVPLRGREYVLPVLQRMSHTPPCQSWRDLAPWGQGGDQVEAKGLALNPLPHVLTLEGFQQPLPLSISWNVPRGSGLLAVEWGLTVLGSPNLFFFFLFFCFLFFSRTHIMQKFLARPGIDPKSLQ